eukprot:7169128-Lingulodinium_polyedra.AAC.1
MSSTGATGASARDGGSVAHGLTANCRHAQCTSCESAGDRQKCMHRTCTCQCRGQRCWKW